MNKGLEVIEAHHLFGVSGDAHRRAGAPAEPRALAGRVRRRLAPWPSSACPDMRTALAVGLGWPRADRLRASPALDLLAQGGRLEFEAPDLDAFPCLRAGVRRAGARAAPPRPCSMPPTKSRFQPSFRAGSVSCAIPALVEATLDAHCRRSPADSLDALLRDADAARGAASARRATLPHVQRSADERRGMSDFFGSMWWLLVSARRAGDLPRIRPLLGRPPLRGEGAALLGRLRQAAVVAPRQDGTEYVIAAHPAGRLREDARRARRRRRRRTSSTARSTASRSGSASPSWPPARWPTCCCASPCCGPCS